MSTADLGALAPRALSPHVTVDGFAFEREVTAFGTFKLRALRLPEDLGVLHSWVSQEYARYWGMVGLTPEQVAAGYAEICRKAEVYLGFLGEQPSFLVECYHPAHHPVGNHYQVEPGDRGMHVLLSPPDAPRAGFSSAVFTVVMDFLFEDAAARRVVVEPDIRNAKIHALNRRAGFRYQRMLELPNKTAHLAFCTREDYLAARRGAAPALPEPTPRQRADAWSAANRALVCKALSELAHERVLEPRALNGAGEYALAADLPTVAYRFRARVLALNHWDVDPTTVQRWADGEPSPVDALDFVLDFRQRLAVDPELLPIYLEEISSTLGSAAFKRSHQRLSSADLVHADFQELEGAMTEGHPAFIANSGRVGFDANDFLAYAPEATAPIQLVWLAAHRSRAELSTSAELTYERLLDEELGGQTVARFNGVLEEQGLRPEDYLFLPAHPWQWFNKLALTFAPDVATRHLVCLGYGPDSYRAQQSIRTLFNVSHPQRRYVKMALSVLNMGFMRGLSADYMRGTPAINDWLQALVEGDGYFASKGFRLLREVAAVGYRNPSFEAAVPKTSPYRKLLAALWRESPVPKLRPGQRLMTMAALLHRDRDGAALVPQLIKAAGVDVDTWLTRYLESYLAPLVHCFLQHDLAFMPHGENLILVLEDNLPVGVFLKDLAEEVVLMDPARELPERVARIRASVPEALKSLTLFTDVFDGVFRYLAQILLEQAAYPEEQFWRQVAQCLSRYREEHPALREKFDRYDPFAQTFPHSCLNRLQLRNTLHMVDLSDPAKALAFAGTLENPVARFRAPAVVAPKASTPEGVLS